MNNQDILLFIKKDEYYNNKKYEKNNTLRTLKVFDGLDIKTLSLVEWKKYNFMEIFKNQLKNFSIKISYFVKHMKDFGLLYELFNINEIQKIPHEYINALKDRFKQLFDTYTQKGCPKFVEDTAKLLYLQDKNKEKLEEALSDLQNLLGLETINDILIKLSEYEDISKDLKKKIVEFFTKGKNENPATLVFLIKNCKKLRKEIFQNILMKHREI